MDGAGLIAFAQAWAEAGLRWFHVVAGIAWIGSSFYFIALDFSLKPRDHLPQGAYGEAWQVHGGGFYHIVKYLVAPARMPAELTWFKWESYATWMSGVALMSMVYYLNASLYLTDPQVLDLTPGMAIGYSIGGLILGWAVYDALCRSPLGAEAWTLGLIGWAGLVLAAFGFTHLFSPRGAMMEIGALIGTMMTANVFMVIIPGQTKVVADLIAGRKPDPAIGARAKQRSLHNNYLTLPVVFVMIANHYPLFFATRWNWAILGLVMVMGALIRHFFNTKHKGLPLPWWTIGAAGLCMAAGLVLSFQGSRLAQNLGGAPQASLADAREIISTRCVMCHADEPVWAGLATAPKGVRFDNDDLITRHRGKIAEWAVMTQAMPPANLTEITTQERMVLAAWARGGTSEQNQSPKVSTP